MLGIIRFYRRWISPLLPPHCRFMPTCSQYACEAIETFGVSRGMVLTVTRVCKCHPFHPGGYDPVPENEVCSVEAAIIRAKALDNQTPHQTRHDE